MGINPYFFFIKPFFFTILSYEEELINHKKICELLAVGRFCNCYTIKTMWTVKRILQFLQVKYGLLGAEAMEYRGVDWIYESVSVMLHGAKRII